MADPTARELIRRLAQGLRDTEEALGVERWPISSTPSAIDLADEADAWLAANPEPVAGPTDEELLRTYGGAKRDHCYDGPIDDWPKRSERAATVHGLRAVLARYGHHPQPAATADPLAVKALAVLEAIAEMVAKDEPITLAKDWGFGGATLIAPDGSHTHIGGDDGKTRDENLALFVNGLYQLLVEGCGLSFVPSAPAKVEPQP